MRVSQKYHIDLTGSDRQRLVLIKIRTLLHPAVNQNLLQNPDFELDKKATANPTGWTIANPPADGHFDVRREDAKNGEYALHWYSTSDFSKATATATVIAPVSGTYEVSGYFQGSATSSVDFRLSAGFGNYGFQFALTGWNNWYQVPTKVHANAGETLTVTLTVNGTGESFGSMDQCSLVLKEADPVQEETKPVTTTTVPVTTTTTTTTTTVTTTTTTAAPAAQALLRGDCNCSNMVDVSDAVLLARFLAEDRTAKLSDQGRKNADCNADGDLNSDDVLAILRKIAKLD